MKLWANLSKLSLEVRSLCLVHLEGRSLQSRVLLCLSARKHSLPQSVSRYWEVCMIIILSNNNFKMVSFWLVKSRVSITVWKTWKGSCHYTPSHMPSWTVYMETLRFDEEDYFHVLVFCTGYVLKEIENISPVFPYSYRNICGKTLATQIWEKKIFQAPVEL